MPACGGQAAAPQAASTTGRAAPAGAVTLAGGAVSSPDIAVDGRGGIHVAWVVGLTDEAKILHRYLAPGGGQWSEPRELTTGFQYNGAPRLLTDPNGDVCVFWKATVPQAALYTRCFADGDWSDAKEAVPAQGLTAGYSPGFAPDGTAVAAYEIPPSTIGFEDVTLSPEGVIAGGVGFAVDADGAHHVTWTQFAGDTDELGGEVWRTSTDGGATWSEPELVSETGSLTSELVADSVGGVHWVETNGTYRGWRSSTGWGEETDLGGVGLDGARVAADASGRPSVLFSGLDGLYLTEQAEDGTWPEPELLEPADGSVDAAGFVIDDHGTRHVVWVTTDDEAAVHYSAHR